MDLTQKQQMGKLMMEAAWLLLTGIIVWLLAQPYWRPFKQHDFVYQVMIFAVVFITYARYLFLLKYTFLSHFQVMKFLLIFLSIPLAFYLVQLFFDYQDFLERQNEGMEEFGKYFQDYITLDQRYQILRDLTPLYNFLGISAIITVIIMPFRLLISFWRVYNKTGMV